MGLPVQALAIVNRIVFRIYELAVATWLIVYPVALVVAFVFPGELALPPTFGTFRIILEPLTFVLRTIAVGFLLSILDITVAHRRWIYELVVSSTWYLIEIHLLINFQIFLIDYYLIIKNQTTKI